ncbi:MBOAT, membrane-bound O-acyltransferase family-domain-containing protein [Lipomyces arxii]|uniref:MBOAT, membrane-bound O-acyltransferase family-domain-containing protein n=1 Tax=Lipomyces arxii TaxID=56418 RepID=UPI0034CE4DD2
MVMQTSIKSVAFAEELVTTELPAPAKSAKSLRRFPVTEYVVRPSLFSYQDDLGMTPASQTESEKEFTKLEAASPNFSGFYCAFWVMMCTSILRPLAYKWHNNESLRELSIPRLSLTRLSELTACEIVLNGITLSCVYIQKLFASGTISWTTRGWIYQSFFELAFVVGWITWLVYIDWPWPHSIFFVLHIVVHLMKIHSYSFYNGWLSSVYRQLRALPSNKSDELRAALILELTSPLGNVVYPANLTLANSWDWLLVPSVSYDLEFPRTPAVRRHVMLNRTLALIGAIVIFYLHVEFQIAPVIAQAQAEYGPIKDDSIAVAGLIIACALQIMLPMMISVLMAFFIIWELVLNLFAEITRFGDRLFYEDWWNSCSQLEFARRWNTVVYRFLWRHIYRPVRSPLRSITAENMNKPPPKSTMSQRAKATFMTFLVSSVFHEVVASTSTRKFKVALFCLQMSQIGMIWMQELEPIKRHRTVGVVTGWSTLTFGLSLNLAMYLVTM